MIKKRILVTTSCFFSTLALVGCGGKKNINMQTRSNLLNERWDTLASQICLPTSDKTPSTNDPKFMENFTKVLSVNPGCFVPSADKNDNAKYQENRKLVNEYVANMAQKITATEIISFEKLSVAAKNRDVDFKEYDLSAGQSPKTNALNYIQRDEKSPIDLSHFKTPSGLNENSEFSIFGTTKGKLDNNKNTRGKAYVLKYRLADNNIYTALITIPEGDTNVPLMLYAHGGDTGISFREMATLLQDNLNKYIVAAPAFPGEPICSIDKKAGGVDKGFKRVCLDNSDNEIAPAVEAIGEKSPLENDVIATLGLHNALTKISMGELLLNGNIIKEFFINGDKDKPKLEFYVRNVPSFLNSYKPILKKIAGPKTIATASSRGGATMLAAIGRSGIMLQQAIAQLDNKNVELKNIIVPPLFSSVATYFAPTSLLMGKFRILFRDVMNGVVPQTSLYNALPMIPDLMNNRYFTNFRNTNLANNQKELKELIGFLGASDITYLAPYISVATQNWSNNLDNILNLEKLLDANSEKSEDFLRKTLGTLGKQNIRTKEKPLTINEFLGEFLTAFIDHKENENSLLKHFSISLLKKVENTSEDPCSIVLNTGSDPMIIRSTGDCSVRGIFTKGVGTLDLLGTKKELNLKPVFSKDDEVNIKKLSTLFKNLSDDKYGLKNFTDALASRKNDESVVKSLGFLFASLKEADIELSIETIKNLIPYMITSSISIQLGFEPYKDNFDSNNPNLNTIFVASVDLEEKLPLLKNIINSKDLLDGLKEKLKNYIIAYRKASPGSILLIHNTQDQIVDHTQSLIAKTAFDTVFGMSFGSAAKSFELNFSNIPPVGTQFIAFQPEKKFYTVPVGERYNEDRLASCSDEKNDNGVYKDPGYNAKENKCFAKKGNYAHGDPAFLTGKVINTHLLKLDPVLPNKFVDVKITPMAKALMYGYGEDQVNYSTYVSNQIRFMNETLRTLNPQIKPEQELLTSCQSIGEPRNKDANCFIYGAKGMSSMVESIPLYTRTLFQDADSIASLKSGLWSKNAEEQDSMSPTDVMSMWLATSAKATLEVQR